MRGILSTAIVLAVLIAPANVVAQVLPPLTERQRIQKQVEDRALTLAEDLERRVKGLTLGSLGLEANLAIRRWDEAVRLWKREKDAGSAPLLAEGVLFDCLSRLRGVNTRPLSSERAGFNFADLAAARPQRAVTALNAAVTLDPALVEARMRSARIRAFEETGAAHELEQLAEGGPPGSAIAYLAAVSRAEVGQAHRDAEGAIRWYERALVYHPRSTAATMGLVALKPAAALSFDGLDARDLYYTYPCTVLTADVSAALSARVRNVVLK
jgi:hypothetical protein